MNIKRKFKTLWWLILSGASLLYIYIYWSRYQSNEIYLIDQILFIIFLILMLFPLISEINIWGMSIKKDIENVSKDLKQTKSEISEKLLFLQSLSLSNNFSPIINNYTKTNEPDNMIMEEVTNYLKANNKINISSVTSNVTEDEKYLFSARLSIEKELHGIFQSIGDSNSNRLGIISKTQALYKMAFLDAITVDSIQQIINVCNSAIHGNEIESSQIQFVQYTLPFVLYKLQHIKVNDVNTYHIHCPRCNFTGKSKYLNVCPNCNFTFNDD